MRLTRSSFLFCILIILSLKLNWAKKLDKRNHKKEHSGHENVTELCVHNTDCSTDSFVCCKSHLCCSYEDYKHHLKKCGNPGTSLGCGGGNSLVCCKNDSLCRLKQDCSSEKEYVGNLKLLHFTVRTFPHYSNFGCFLPPLTHSAIITVKTTEKRENLKGVCVCVGGGGE